MIQLVFFNAFNIVLVPHCKHPCISSTLGKDCCLKYMCTELFQVSVSGSSEVKEI